MHIIYGRSDGLHIYKDDQGAFHAAIPATRIYDAEIGHLRLQFPEEGQPAHTLKARKGYLAVWCRNGILFLVFQQPEHNQQVGMRLSKTDSARGWSMTNAVNFAKEHQAPPEVLELIHH